MLANPRDAVVVEEEVSLKFAEVSYLRSVAVHTSQKGPQNRLVHAGNGRKYHTPEVFCGRVEDRHPKHTALGFLRNTTYDLGGRLFANSVKSLDFDDLASE